MRWFVTFLLIVAVAGCAVWLVLGEKIRSSAGLAKTEPISAPPETIAILDRSLSPDAIRSLRVTVPGHSQLVLNRNADKSWSQPGNWPLRDGEVSGLVNAICTIRSRFAAIPLDKSSPDVAPYGLSDSAKRVEVIAEVVGESGTKTVALRFGRPDASAGDPEFTRATFLRVDDQPEVIRLGPDLFPLLARSPEVYRRRQLFPDAERAKFAGDTGSRVPFLGDRFTSIAIEKTEGDKSSAFTLTRTAKTPEPRRDADRPASEPAINTNSLAAAWILETAIPDPADKDGKKKLAVRDRPDPAKLKTILTAVPELWVEAFKTDAKNTGLEKPERTITITPANGKAITVLIGGVSRSSTKVEPPPPAPMFGAPPPPPKVTTEEFRYAKLKDNDLVFELKADKLGDLFADPAEVRDAQLARFETAEVTEFTVTMKGKPPVKVMRKKGNKDAEKDEDKQDRWYVGEVLAEAAKVTELLDSLSKLEARKESVLDAVDAAKLKELEIDPAAGTTVVVTAQAKVAEGDPAIPPRTIIYAVGKDDPEKKKLAVQVAGWQRVNLVDDTVFKLLDRPALAYRGRRLFDTAELKLESVTVKKDAGDPFALALKAKTAPDTGTAWSLTQPVAAEADEAKASQLAGDLSRLEVVEYVDDAPKPEDLDKKYGLAKPRFSVDLGFTGPGAKPQKLDVGSVREGKTDAYGRLNGAGSVFAVPKNLLDSLEGGALGFLPLQLWSSAPDRVTAVDIRRGESAMNEAYKLVQAGLEWKVSGPFDANANSADVPPLLALLATLKADKYDALKPDPAKHGLDKPVLRLAVTYSETKTVLPGLPPKDVLITKTIVVGKETAAGANARFAMLEGGTTPAVFIIPDAILKEADKPALARLDKTLLNFDAGKIAKVQIAGPTPDSAVTLTKDDKGVWKAGGANFPLDDPTVKALIATAARPPVARLAAFGPTVNWTAYGLDKPEFTITVSTAGEKPESHTLKLGKADMNGERHVRADDGPAAGVLFPNIAGNLAKGKLDFVDRTLIAFEPAAFSGFTRTKGKDTFELGQVGIVWELTQPAKQKADKSTAEDLADLLARLRAVKVAAVAPADLAPFGLKDPEAVLTLSIGTGKKILKIGKPVDAGKPDGDRYALADGSNPVIVGVLAGPIAARLLAEPLKFRDKSLAKFVDADKLVLERGDRKATFEKKDGTWKLTAPITTDAEQADLDELVNALANLRADELMADKPADLKPFGLNPPEAKWTITAGREEIVLMLGTTQKESNRLFAKLGKGEKQDLVVLLDPVLTAKVSGEYRKRTAFTDLDASQVESVAISSGPASFVLLKDALGWRDPAKPGDSIDAAKVTELLAALAGLKAERFVNDSAPADKLSLYGLEPGKARIVIAVTQKGGTTKTVQIGGPEGTSGGKKTYAKLSDSPAVMLLSEADTAKLTRDRNAYLGKK